MVYLVRHATGCDMGLSSCTPGLENLQKQVLNIERDIGDIKTTTEHIADNTQSLVCSTDAIRESQQTIESSVGQLGQTMGISVAMEFLDRAAAAKTGSLQGQRAALQTLIKAGQMGCPNEPARTDSVART